MTVMSEGLLLNSKYMKMACDEGGSQALLTQLPLVIVCRELIIWRLTDLRLCDGLSCRIQFRLTVRNYRCATTATATVTDSRRM